MTPMSPAPIRRAALFAFLGLAFAGCAAEVADPGIYIALGRDLDDYESWSVFDRGVDPVPPSHEGRSVIYLDPLPDPGATEFAVGTRIVRVEEVGDDPTTWQVHAMVKRGGGFNPDGALGWEFFELSLTASHEPFIVWRGEGPADGDGYLPPEGGDLLSCNHCHGAAIENDSVLSPVLDLRVLASEE